MWVSSWWFYFAFPDEQRRCGPSVTPAPSTDWAQSRCSGLVESARILDALQEPPLIWTLQRNHGADFFRNQPGELERNKTIPYLEALPLKQGPLSLPLSPKGPTIGLSPRVLHNPLDSEITQDHPCAMAMRRKVAVHVDHIVAMAAQLREEVRSPGWSSRMADLLRHVVHVQRHLMPPRHRPR